MQPGSLWLLVGIGVLSFALAFIGAAVGLVLGHLRLPLLIAYLGSPTAGAMTNLLISGSGALGGSASHVRAGRVSWPGVALIGIPSAIGAVIAVLIFVRINPLWSYMIIGVMLIISGLNLVRKKSDDKPPEPITPLRRYVVEIVIGLGLGALAAITGLMLGSLRLPMMIRYLGMDPKEAVGTNMVVGCLTAAVGALTGLLAGDGRLDLLVLAVVVPPTLLGGWLGAWLTGRISKAAVQKFAGWVVAVTGILLVAQGAVGTVRKPRIVVPPIVQEWEYDDWFDFDYYRTEDQPPPRSAADIDEDWWRLFEQEEHAIGSPSVPEAPSFAHQAYNPAFPGDVAERLGYADLSSFLPASMTPPDHDTLSIILRFDRRVRFRSFVRAGPGAGQLP